MKYKFLYGSEVLSLPAGAIRGKLASCSAVELKLICAMAADRDLCASYETKADGFAADIGCTREELDRALAFWIDAGAISAEEKKPQKQSPRRKSDEPIYTGEELAGIIEEDDLAGLIDECSRILGITMNPTDVNTIVSLRHHLGVENAYILLICDYCRKIGKRSLAYARKTAYNLYDEGVDTPERLESYIQTRDRLFSLEGTLRRLFGIDGRALTAKETKCFENWCAWGYKEDIIRLAYDITVEKTGKYTVSYLDRVLSNWHESGYMTVDDVKAALAKFEESKGTSGGSFDTDDFFEAALKRSRDNAVKLNEVKKS